MRSVNEIIVHCAATQPNWWSDRSAEEKAREVRQWHLDRGWKDVGYHWLIDRDGTVVKGRDESVTGAHVKGRNSNTIGICLFGGHGSGKDDTFEEYFTPEQDAALRRLIAEIEQRHTITKVSGHNEYANKACPGFNVRSWLNNKPVPAPRTSVAQSTTVQASAVQIASGAGAAASSVALLDGTAQLVALSFAGLVVLMGLWIMRERIRKWADGDR
jgi:N-acetylmuramoyl-L-alanine amidase